jgi:hypothetical protein
MKLLKDQRGQIRVIEAFFASVLLLSSLALVPLFENPQTDNSANLTSTALNILASLDRDAQLADLVGSRNWTNLKCIIQSCVPLTLWFNLTVFDTNMTAINPDLITSGGLVADSIVAANYVCASSNENYQVYILRLQLAGVD